MRAWEGGILGMGDSRKFSPGEFLMVLELVLSFGSATQKSDANTAKTTS